MSSFEHDTQPTSFSSSDRMAARRPSFSQTRTSDRLRENDRRTSISTSFKKPRRSVFREEGLEDLEHTVHPSHHAHNGLKKSNSIPEEEEPEKNATFDGILKDMDYNKQIEDSKRPAWGFPKLRKGRPRIMTSASAPPNTFSTLPRVALIVFLIAVVIPGFQYTTGKGKGNISGVDAGVIMRAELVENGSAIEGRQNSPTSVCTRWAGQGMACATMTEVLANPTSC